MGADLRAREISSPWHFRPQAFFSRHCSVLRHRKGCEQTVQIFNRGYGSPRCDGLGVGEFPSFSEDETAMVRCDDLICAIRPDAIGVTVEGVDESLLDWLPCEDIIPGVVAQSEASFNGFMVRLPPTIYQYLGILTETPVGPVQHPLDDHGVTGVEPCQPHGDAHEILRAGSREHEEVSARFQHP